MICIIVLFVSLALSATAGAHAVLYGSPGPEQEQLQAWIDTSHAPTPSVRVRLYEGNCEQDRLEGSPAERHEEPGREASVIQSCAAFTLEGHKPSRTNEAIYFPHMSWHQQMPAWWWHLNLLNELGHTYDILSNDRSHYREKFSAISGYDAKWWFPVNAWAAMNKAWEKWSMAFAFCGYGASYANAHVLITNDEYSGFGFAPGPLEYTQTCRLIDTLPR